MKTILHAFGYVVNKKYYDDAKINLIKKELTVEPYTLNNNFYSNNKFKVYLENKTQICIPKYYGIENFGKPDIDDIEEGVDIELKFNGSLRDYQINIMNIFYPKFIKTKGGLLCIPPGKGKTVLAIWLLTLLKKKTLIIVHKTFLVNQWKKRLEQYVPDAKIGIIQQNKIEVEDKDIVIGMLHSLCLKDYDMEIFEDFGLCIIDEVHHLGAQVFSKVFKKTNFNYMCGLSATPKREDKLEKVIYWHIGNILYYEAAKVSQEIDVIICNYNIEHKLFIEVINKRTHTAQMATMITNLTNIHERTKMIINFILDIKKKENGRKILILSERLEHLDRMKQLVDDNSDISTSKYIGGMKEKKLEEAEEADIIFSTYQMSSEGLDIPTLNTIVLTTSRKNVEQSVGRILRKQSGYSVKPLIIDIVDGIKQFKNQGSIRKRYYKKITKEDNIKIYKNSKDNFISN